MPRLIRSTCSKNALIKIALKSIFHQTMCPKTIEQMGMIGLYHIKFGFCFLSFTNGNLSCCVAMEPTLCLPSTLTAPYQLFSDTTWNHLVSTWSIPGVRVTCPDVAHWLVYTSLIIHQHQMKPSITLVTLGRVVILHQGRHGEGVGISAELGT